MMTRTKTSKSGVVVPERKKTPNDDEATMKTRWFLSGACNEVLEGAGYYSFDFYMETKNVCIAHDTHSIPVLGR